MWPLWQLVGYFCQSRLCLSDCNLELQMFNEKCCITNDKNYWAKFIQLCIFVSGQRTRINFYLTIARLNNKQLFEIPHNHLLKNML